MRKLTISAKKRILRLFPDPILPVKCKCEEACHFGWLSVGKPQPVYSMFEAESLAHLIEAGKEKFNEDLKNSLTKEQEQEQEQEQEIRKNERAIIASKLRLYLIISRARGGSPVVIKALRDLADSIEAGLLSNTEEASR